MYVTVRRYADKGAQIEKLVPPVRDGLVPLLKRARGFKGYCAFASQDGNAVSISVFADRESATRANDQVRAWVGDALKDLLPDPPEVLAGEALLHKEAELQSGGAEMFAAVRVWEGVGPQEEVLPMVREHAFPVITGAPGFRGYYTFLDERVAGRGVSASLFDTREHATAVQEKIVAVMREKRIAPNPPHVMAGRTVVAATAS